MNYPRRRAPIACNFCRQRKRKCDSRRPACRLCATSGVQCDYGDGPAVDALVGEKTSQPSPRPANEDVLRRLDELEALLRRQAEHTQESQAAAPPAQPPPDDAAMAMPLREEPFNPVFGMDSFLSSVFMPPEINLEPQPLHTPTRGDELATPEEPLTIPTGHLTPTANLLLLDPVQRLIGEYPADYFFQIEAQRPFEPIDRAEETKASLRAPDGHDHSPALAAFFSSVHPHFPMVDPEPFMAFFHRVTANVNDAEDTDRALCLMVLALGNSVLSSCDASDVAERQFAAAYHLLVRRWALSFGTAVSLASGLVYGAIYLCYQQRPLHASRLVYMASANLQMMVSQGTVDNTVGRLYWGCFLLECDMLAELHLPRSGIEVVIDNMPFPGFTDPADRDGLTFLAICSIRRLLNRIHRAIYVAYPESTHSASSPGSAGTPPTAAVPLGSVCAELSRQLDTWYESLPPSIKPDLYAEDVTNDGARSLQQGWLRSRYWSAKHIISRPCLLYAAQQQYQRQDDLIVPTYVMHYSEMCIEACKRYIRTSASVLGQQTQYSWMTVQAALACVFVISVASGSPVLSHLTADLGELLDVVLVATERWAVKGSSAESIVWILRTLSHKHRFLRPPQRGTGTSTGTSGLRVLGMGSAF